MGGCSYYCWNAVIVCFRLNKKRQTGKRNQLRLSFLKSVGDIPADHAKVQ